MKTVDPLDLFFVHAIIEFEKLPLASDFLFQKAQEIGCVITPFDWTRSTCHGLVLGQDASAWLIKISNRHAGVLAFSEIADNEISPRLGDSVRLEFRHGIVKVDVTISPKNAWLDTQKHA